jgi:two-component system sensor histidine kinase QseC
MKKSIKTNLIIKLSSLIAITLTATYIAAYVSVRNEINLVLDADLAKSSKLILGVVSHDGFVHSASNLESELSQKVFNKFEYKIHIQAWKGSRMVYNSGEKLDVAKPDYSGFKDVWLQDKWWRSFAINDQVSDITVLVLEKSALRNHLINEILVTLLIPLIICFAPLFLIIISAVKSELSPLKSVAKSIEEISTKTLKKYRSPSVPVEMAPFVDSFNSLLARLDQSMESERRFSDYAAHELNTPLAAIKLQAQIIASGKHPQKNSEYLADLLSATDRAAHLVEQLLTLSRLEIDDKDLAKEEFDLNELLAVLIESKSQIFANKKLKISVQKNDAPNLVRANKIYIQIMIENLLENAFKYSFDESEINIKIECGIVEIVNRGKQISAEEVAKIFDNFYRAKNSQDQVGSGLGLAIARKIANLHGGEIYFSSNAEKTVVSADLNGAICRRIIH